MSIKLSDLAQKLGLDVEQLRGKIISLGFEVGPKARVIDNEVADLVSEELSKVEAPAEESEESGDIVDIYDELISEEREREIVKSQRKMMAGKEKAKTKNKPTTHPVADPKKREVKAGIIEIADSITVKEFAEKTGVNVAKVIGELMKNGILANINQLIDFDTAQVISDDLGIKLKRIRTVAGIEELMAGDLTNLLKEDDSSLLQERPPVVVIMGHVDHGKTKLLDTIRETDVVSGESGGITQHIGAYQVRKKDKLITFLDTPGHEAFTAMRARGAKVTDIAILVVAADEGVKPQTIEALNHAKEAGVPIIVAANKIDKPDANMDKLRGELAEHGLQPEEWGGDTVIVPVSALTGQGVDDLLDMILLTTEMQNLKANPNREAVGTVIEAHLDHNLGPVASILVNTGTLKIMNNVIVGHTYGRIKLMRDHNGKDIRTASPSTPVFIAGLSDTPKSGDILQVVATGEEARERAEEIALIDKQTHQEHIGGLNQLISHMKSHKVLKLILKVDVKGSLEAIKQSLGKIKDEEVAIKIIHSGVGTVTESDVMMASASKGLIIAFNTDFDSSNVSRTAERENVEVKKYNVIYHLLEDVTSYLSGMLEDEVSEVILGRAQIKKIFFTKKKRMIIGARVLSGKLQNKAKLRIVRGQNNEGEDIVVGNGVIDSLKKIDESVHEINEGNECGIMYIGDEGLLEGDTLVAYKQESKKRTL